MFEQFGIINPWIYIAGAFMIVIAPGPEFTLCFEDECFGWPACRLRGSSLPY